MTIPYSTLYIQNYYWVGSFRLVHHYYNTIDTMRFHMMRTDTYSLSITDFTEHTLYLGVRLTSCDLVIRSGADGVLDLSPLTSWPCWWSRRSKRTQEPKECPTTDTPPWKLGFLALKTSNILFISEATWLMMVCMETWNTDSCIRILLLIEVTIKEHITGSSTQ